MILEHRLTEKVTTKEAERLRQQRATELELAQAEALQKQKEEELFLAGLRQSIIDVDAKIEQMEAFLVKLKSTHELASVQVAGAKKEGKELSKAIAEVEKLFIKPNFRELLAEEGINSVDDLLEAAEYAEEDEVRSVKGLKLSHIEKRQLARESIGARRQVKMEISRVIPLARGTAQKSPYAYKEVLAVLEEVVQDLGRERKKLFYQTPEGQAALKAEILNRVGQRHKTPNYYQSLASKQEIDRQQTVVTGDLEDVGEYEEIQVRIALKTYWEEVIERSLIEKAKRNGWIQLQEALHTIENLPNSWHKIRVSFEQLQQARQQTIRHLAGFLGDNCDSLLGQRINNYLGRSSNDPYKSAEDFIDSCSALNVMSLGFGMQDGTVEVILEKIIISQKNLIEKAAKSGNLREIFPRSEVSDGSYQSETKLENPERIVIILAEQIEFYQKFQRALTTPEEIIEKIRGYGEGLDQEIKVRSEYDLGLAGQGAIKPRLKFDGRTYAILRDRQLSDIKVSLELQQREFEQALVALKEQLKDKIDLDWNSVALQKCEKVDGYKTLREAIRIIDTQKIIKRLLPGFDLATAQLQEKMDELVQFDNRVNLKFSSVPERDLQQLQNEINELQKKIKIIEVKILAIDERAAREGDGLLGGKKKRRQLEKSILETEKQPLQERLGDLQAEFQPKIDMDNKLGEMRSWLFEAQRNGLELKISRGPISLRKFIDNIKQQINLGFTEEQSRVYEQYQVLVEKQKKVEDGYKKWETRF